MFRNTHGLTTLSVAAVLLGSLVLAGPTALGQDDGSADAVDPSERDFDLPKGSKGLERLAMELKARERALERRERTVGKREADLQTTKALLTERMDELAALRDELDVLVKKVEDAQDTRLVGLIAMVDKMRDKQAAPFLLELDADLAVRVIDRMNRAKAGKALAAMPPADAAKLAEKLTRPVQLPAGAR